MFWKKKTKFLFKTLKSKIILKQSNERMNHLQKSHDSEIDCSCNSLGNNSIQVSPSVTTLYYKFSITNQIYPNKTPS